MGGLILAGAFVDMERRSAVAAWAARLFFGLGGAGMLWHFGYGLLDTQGISTKGQVLESEAIGDKNKPYLIRYTFISASGRRMESVDPVFHADYQRLHRGDAIHVRYAPVQPDISAIAQSVGRRYAVGDIFMGSIFVACAAGLPFIVFWEARSKRRAASNTA